MTPSRSGTRCPPNQRRPPATRRRQPANCGCTVKVTFCVRGVLSPLLANLYMRQFVLGWKKLGLEQSLGTRLVTYADDLVILCRQGGAGHAEATLRRTVKWGDGWMPLAYAPGEEARAAFDKLRHMAEG